MTNRKPVSLDTYPAFYEADTGEFLPLGQGNISELPPIMSRQSPDGATIHGIYVSFKDMETLLQFTDNPTWEESRASIGAAYQLVDTPDDRRGRPVNGETLVLTSSRDPKVLGEAVCRTLADVLGIELPKPDTAS